MSPKSLLILATALSVALLLSLDLRRLEHQIQGVEARMDAGPPWRGAVGSAGGRP